MAASQRAPCYGRRRFYTATELGAPRSGDPSRSAEALSLRQSSLGRRFAATTNQLLRKSTFAA
eukprot:15441659-Alexandrium_andersonii.AAC.1